MSLSAQKNSLFGSAGNKKSDNSNKKTSSGGGSVAPSSSSSATSNGATRPAVSAATTSGTSVPKAPTTSAKSNSVPLVGLPPAQKAKKIAEAQEYMEKATQALKKTIFSWKPDHLAAAPNFESAANSYKMAGELELAHSTMLQSVDSHEKAGTLAAAALTCVKAAQIAQMMERFDVASADWERSAELWGANGELDKCAETLAKAAKELVQVQPSQALALYKRACDLICAPDTPPEAMGRLHPSAIAIMRDTLAFMLSDNCRQEEVTGKAKARSAINTIKDGSALAHAKRLVQLFQGFEMESSMCKTMCAVTVIQLTMGDIVQADHTYLQDHLSNKQYIVSRECRLAEDFIMAIKTHDIDKMDAALSNTDLNYLEPREVVLLCKKLSVFSSEGSSSSSTSAEKQLYKAADQMAQDMADLMKMAPKSKSKSKTNDKTAQPAGSPTAEPNSAKHKVSAAPAASTVSTATAKGGDDDDNGGDDDEEEEWVPSTTSSAPNKLTPIVDDDDDELDLT